MFCCSSLLKVRSLRPMFPLYVSSPSPPTPPLSLPSLPACLCFYSTSSNFLSTSEKMEGASGIPPSLFPGSCFAHKHSSNPAALGAVPL